MCTISAEQLKRLFHSQYVCAGSNIEIYKKGDVTVLR